jgi:4-alpha-glucanotransferase
MSDQGSLRHLAEQAGIAVHWNNALGEHQEVADETLISVLAALGLEAHSDLAVARSLDLVHAELSESALPPLVTTEVSSPIRLQCALRSSRVSWRLELETGQTSEGEAEVSESGEVVIPGIRTPGYHRLQLGAESTTLAVAPARCYGVSDAVSGSALGTGIAGRPAPFGVNLQIYSLRRQQATGLGDFTALEQFCHGAAALGVDAVGINPVHAGFSADPSRFSPYAPSSRLFLNALYIDPAATFGTLATQAVTNSLDIDAKLAELDALPLVDWAESGAIRLKVLRGLFARREALLNSQLRAEFDAFIEQGGEALRDHARYEALHQLRFPGTGGWQQWPEAERNPRSEEVAKFAADNAEEVEFHCFLQWLAARDLRGVQQQARSAGMSIGIVGDLAVGTDPGGSHAWSRQAEIIKGLVCGAPPDIYNPLGQSWGLTAFSPRALRQNGYRAFIEMLRATLSTAGALRIDHVLGLARLWLVPEHASPTHGAYMAYPISDLLRLVALESWRHHAVIIGENLGTVPAGFNQTLEHHGLLGTTVLWFERSHERVEVFDRHGHQHHIEAFRSSHGWPANDMAVTTTHDLPTVAGWWAGHDIEWRTKLNLLAPGRNIEDEMALRRLDRGALWRALESAGLASGAMPESDAAPQDAILQFVAMAPAPLVMFPIEDLLGTVEQPNLPGTFDEHPNWRRRQTRPVSEILSAGVVRERFLQIQTRRRGQP